MAKKGSANIREVRARKSNVRYIDTSVEKGGKGAKVKSRKQAIAIALSKARKKGNKVPKKK